MSDISAVQQVVFAIIAKEAALEPDRISLDSTLQDLGIGSLTAVEIAFAIEDHFKIDIPDRDPSLDVDAATVGGLVATVQGLLDSGPKPAVVPPAT